MWRREWHVLRGEACLLPRGETPASCFPILGALPLLMPTPFDVLTNKFGVVNLKVEGMF